MFQEFPDDSKNDDFLNEFRQKIADQSAANFEEKRIEMKRSKSVFHGARFPAWRWPASSDGSSCLRGMPSTTRKRFRLFADRRPPSRYSQANRAAWKF